MTSLGFTTFEVRRDDRAFHVGDVLVLQRLKQRAGYVETYHDGSPVHVIRSASATSCTAASSASSRAMS